MRKVLSSLLMAMLIYLSLLGAVLYGYKQYQTKLSEVATDKSQVVAFDVISTAAPKVKKQEEKEPKKSPHLKSTKTTPPKKTLAAPLKKPVHKPHKTKSANTKSPIAPLKKLTQKPNPKNIEHTVETREKTVPSLTPAPVVIDRDPAKVLALKHLSRSIPVKNAKLTKKPIIRPTKKRIKKGGRGPKQHQTRQKRHRQKKRGNRGNGTHKKRSGNVGKNSFLARLKSRINQNKRYPRIAERRGITGTVRARFTILRNGGVGNISLSGATPFYRSTKSAIERSFPINPTKVPFSLPYRTGLVMRYK